VKRSKGHGHGDTVKKAVTAKIDSEYIDLWRWLEVGVFVVVSWLSVDCDGCLRCVGPRGPVPESVWWRIDCCFVCCGLDSKCDLYKLKLCPMLCLLTFVLSLSAPCVLIPKYYENILTVPHGVLRDMECGLTTMTMMMPFDVPYILYFYCLTMD